MTIRGKGDQSELYALLAAMATKGEEGVLATVIRTARSVPRHVGSKMVVRGDGTVTGSVGGGGVESRVLEEAKFVLADGMCRRVNLNLTGQDGVCGGEVEVFLEPVTASVPVWIIGAGHLGRALVEMGAALPLRFTVVDDREDFLADLNPATVRADSPAELAESFQPSARTAVIVASRHHELDGDYLEALFQAEERTGQRVVFLGLVGSRTKAKFLAGRFADHPRWRERFAEVAIPVGLAIGAETPHEIALSILTEVLAQIRGASFIGDDVDDPQGIYLLRQSDRDPDPRMDS